MQDITLIGYGKMGRMIHSLAESHGCRVRSVIDPSQPDCAGEISADALIGVCLDFSHPDSVLANIRSVTEAGKSLVVGTTGWLSHLPEVEDLVAAKGTGLLYGANFSLGMNLFNHIVAYAAQICDKFPDYDVCGWEMHHNQKADSPSGTALQLAETLVQASSRKDTPVYDRLNRRIEPNELHFASLRGGAVPGTHSVIFDSEADSLELTHRARSRLGFALGALEAAKWLAGRKGVFSFNQMMEDLLC